MTPEEKIKLDKYLDELTKHEVKFLKEQGAEKNEYGTYVYRSANDNHILRLDMFLSHYREWLIENKIVKEI